MNTSSKQGHRGNTATHRSHLTVVLAAWAIATSLFIGASTAPAATLVWTNSDNFWQTTTAWTTNGGETGEAPSPDDVAWLTNATTYTVTLNADASARQLILSNRANTSATVTLNLDTNSLSLLETSTSVPNVSLELGDVSLSTSILYIASSTAAGKGLFATNSAGTGRIAVGRNGVGRLFVTNGFVAAIQTIIGNSATASGSAMVLSGANTYWTNASFLLIGNNAANKFSSLVISNSASLTVGTTFAVGGPSGGGSGTNSLLIDSGGRLFTGTGGTITIGSGAGAGNTATVRGGGVWDNGDRALSIGATGSGNSLTIETDSEVINISTAIVSAANSLILQGGLLHASVDVSNFGTLQGHGIIVGDTVVTNRLSPANASGALVFSNDLFLASVAATTVALGTNFNSTVVSSDLTLDGTLNLTDSGGFTNGTYTLFTYGGALTTNGTVSILTIGTTPSADFTYTIDISTPGEVNLNVEALPPVAAFTGTPTDGETPLSVTFTDTSTGIITNRFWDFGDSNTTNTTATSVDHTYDLAGTNDVTLIVSGPGGSDTNTQLAYVIVTNPPPVADFTASPTTGTVSLVVTFTDASTGTITNRFWDFGDGATTNTTATSLAHTYTNAGTFDVTLSLLGPAGTDTLTRLAYIVATNASPLITSGVTASNALLEAGGVTVVVGGQTNVFSIGATDPGNNPLNFQWSFGDGTTNAWASTNIAEHVYTNCGPFDVEVTVSNNFLAVSSNFTVVVACEMQVTKLQAKLNFKKSDADKFNLTAIVELPDGFDPSGKSVSVNVAGAQATFALDANGKGANAQGTCKLSFNSKTNDWTLKVSQKKGDWQTPWAATGLIDDDVPKPGDAVTLPVVVLVGDEGFAADEPMVYVAKEGKSGTAKQQ